MEIFKISGGKLSEICHGGFALEKEMQKLTEDNLQAIFGLEFVRTEYLLRNLRIDTLAFDKQTKSFVIIEYKRDQSMSVIDQGYAYLALMLNNKADFILEYNEEKKQSLNKQSVDWSQSRVLFLADSFTTYQRNAINFKDLPIELWEVRKYDNGTILYNQLKPLDAAASIATVAKSETVKKVSAEVKKYSIEDHFKSDWKESRGLFDILREKIFELDSRFEEVATKQYIAYKIDRWNVFAITSRKSKLRVDLSRTHPKDIDDSKKIVEYDKNSMKFYGQHISQFFVQSKSDIDYALYIMKQVCSRFLNNKK
ncbi:DUF5655 domain-containing protein [candidate division KSB1 bacterium]